MFIDEVTISVKAGSGGHGCVGFHREKFVPRGGPNGGDGGRGGNVILKVDEGMRTLIDFRWKRQYKAHSGKHGQGSNKHGGNGEDLILRVPIGTVVTQEGSVIGELIRPNDEVLVASGGLGGRGNTHFCTPKRKAPFFAERGEPGKETIITLELKLLADVGLVGFPNVGKSTLVSRVSAAKPKIAPYPFTTLKPNLGMVRLSDDRSFVVADIPGLIEGAHEGKGLGDRFLRHLERSAILLHLIDMSGTERSDPLDDYKIITAEIRNYSADLEKRPVIIVGAKMDLPSSKENLARVKKEFAKKNKDFIAISSVTGEGINELLFKAADLVEKTRTILPVALVPKVEVYTLNTANEIIITRLSKNKFKASGLNIERLVRMADLYNTQAVDYLREKFKRLGLDKALKEAGAVEGDSVVIADEEFEYFDEQ